MTDKPTRLGIQLHPQHATYAAIRDAVKRVEDAGVDIVFNWDHFYPLYGDPDGAHFECWTMLAAWAEQTERIQIGPLVTCNSYRNPELLADMARTVDHISDGRLILGLGSGWFEKDYTEYGYEFGTAGGRLDDLAEALPRIERRLDALNPPPVREMPILIGGGGEKKTLRLVAQYADIWHSFADADELRHKLGVLQGHCDAVGRNIDEIEISVGANAPGREGRPLGMPDQKADDLYAAGGRLFELGVGGPDFDLDGLDEWIAWRDNKNAG